MRTIYPEVGRDIDPKILLDDMGDAKETLGVRKPLNLGDGLVVDVGRRHTGWRLIVKRNLSSRYDIELGKSCELKYAVLAQERDISTENLPDALKRIAEGRIPHGMALNETSGDRDRCDTTDPVPAP